MKNLKLLPLLLLPIACYVQAETEAERRARLAIPLLEVKAPVSGFQWKTEYSSVDYILPCETSDIPYSAIVAHGANHMDLLTESPDGTFSHRYDISRAYPRMFEFCVAIATPKSGLSTVYNESDEAEKWRTWWSTPGVKGADGIPVRDEKEEVAMVIELLRLARGTLHKPVYLVIGNDSGDMSVRISQLLYDNDEIEAIDGIIVTNGGEYSIYHRDGSVWRSEDSSPGG